jgi:hypothetical protein
MDLSKTVACTALILMILLTAGHAFAQKSTRKAAAKAPCLIKPLIEQKLPARRSETTARSAG